MRIHSIMHEREFSLVHAKIHSILGNVGRFGLRYQIGRLGLQLRFDLAGVLVGQSTVPAGIGVDLGPVKSFPEKSHSERLW